MPETETQDAVPVRTQPAAEPSPQADFLVSNASPTPVDLYRIHPEGFSEELIQNLPAGASVVQRAAEGEAWLAKIGDRLVARYTYCSEVPLWQLRLGRGPLVECTFAIENCRAEPVDIYRLSSGGEEPTKSLTVGPGQTVLQESCETERWSAKVGDLPVAGYQVTPRVPCWKIVDAVTGFVPRLPVGDNSHLNEAPNTAEFYQKATGTVRAIMVFVQFPDCAGTKPTRDVAAHVTGDARNWYMKESYGRLSFTVTPCGEWRLMPEKATAYEQIARDGNAHRDYISTALRLFAPDEINFGDYDIAYVVAAETPENVLPNSPTLSAGIDVPTNNGTVRHAVTFGRDCYTRTFNVLLHETGHLMGLPDLYTFGKTYPDLIQPAGAWDIMCHLDGGKHYLGWHKYKLGWLDESQLLYVKSGEVSVTLHDFGSPYGIKLIVLPAESASKVYVVEVAQPLSSEPELCCHGILVYTVDASLATGGDPVKLASGPDAAPEPDETERYGARYYACLPAGDTQLFDLEQGDKIAVTNERQDGSHFLVRVKRSSP
jgi:M6 family metalloprotease-like protein